MTKYTNKHLANRFIREYVRPEIVRILLAIMCMTVFAATSTVQPLLLEFIFDDVLMGKDKLYIVIVPLGVIGLFIVQAFANYGSNVFTSGVGYTVVSKMQKNLFGHFMHHDVDLHSKNKSGELVSRLFNDLMMMYYMASKVLLAIFKQGLTFVGLLCVLFYQSWQLSLITCCAFIFAVYPIIRITKRLRKLARQGQESSADLLGRLNENFRGIRTVKAFRQEETEIKRTNSLIDEFFRLKYKSTKINSLASPIMEILSGVAIATVIWYAARDSLSNIQSQGELVSFIAALIMLARPLKSLNGLNEAIQSSLAAAERFYTMIDSKPKQEPKTGNKPLEVKKGNVEFHKLSFSYVEGQNTLKNISLSIPAGKKVAIVGHSGSGKSTIVNLLLRFYDPDSGKVLIDGQDIREASLESVRGNISLVSQDVFLFSDSMKQNIAYGDSEASDEEIIQAAKDGGAHEFISKMTHGYDTPAGETGILLSGGQRQRIAIARAFLKNSPILVLDEATSSLDPIAEQKIQKTLDKLTKGRTTIIIAHRLSTVRDADIIYVMENGEVVESGKHAELMKKSAIYSNLFSAA